MTKTILITGASSGLGKALALTYAANDVQLLLTGRNQHRLQEVKELCETKGAKVETTTINVIDDVEFINQLNDWDDTYKVDLVIANAGISKDTSHEKSNHHNTFLNVIDVNLKGVVNTVHPFIEKMQNRNKGQMVLISSLAGFRGMPTAVSYSVSKVGVTAYGDALRPLLKNNGVTVTTVYPGFVKTPLTDFNTCPMPFLMSAEKAANIIKRGVEKKKTTIAFPWVMYLFCWALSVMPRFISDRILNECPDKH